MMDCRSTIRAYYDLQPTLFSVLRSFTVSQGIGPNGVCEQRVFIVMGKNLDDEECERLYLEFEGVRQLSVQQPDWSLISIGHIEIMPASETPNVDGEYLVRDPEQERIIWFGCRKFHAYIG